MRIHPALLAAVFAPALATAQEIPGTFISYGNWSGAGYTFDDGTFSHCVVSAQYVHGNSLFFSVNVDATINVGVATPQETFAVGQQFPVVLYVDRRQPFYGTATATDPSFAKLTIQEFDRALDSFRHGRTLTIQSQFGDIPFDLTGTSRALAEVFQCALRNQGYRAAPVAAAAAPTSQVDPAILLQVATGNISALGVTDFTFLTEEEFRSTFPEATAGMQHVFWRSPSLGLLSGVMVIDKGAATDLKAGDAADLSTLANLCGGDFVTGVRQLPDVGMDMREIRAACTTEGAASEHFLTKFFLGDKIVYSWLWFDGDRVKAETAPDRRSMSESVALQTASYFKE